MAARLSIAAVFILAALTVAGCGGDTRRAETEAPESAPRPHPAPVTRTSSSAEPVPVNQAADPARRAYVARVDAVCGQLDPERGAEERKVATAKQPGEAAKAYEGTISLGWRELRRIEAIAEPHGDGAVLRANVFEPIRRQLALRGEIHAALAAVDVPTLRRLRAELDNSTRTLTGFARGYGFQVCGEA